MIFFLSFACGESPSSAEIPITPQDCTLEYREAPQRYSPSEWAETLPFHEGQVLFLAEHHGQAHQLNQLSQAIELLSKREGPIWLAAEWLPASATEKLNALAQSSAWDSKTWWSVISEKYFIAPLESTPYSEPLQTIQRLNQSRSEPIRVLGLAPDCRFQTLKNKSAVTDCLSKRERAMEEYVRTNFPVRSKGMMIISAGYRHAQLAQSNRQASKPLAMRLAQDYSVQSVLLVGREEDGLSTCKGLFDQQKSDSVYSLFNLPHSTLSTSCLSPDSEHDIIPLSSAFTHLWTKPYPWASGSTLSLEAWQSIGEQNLRAWSKFQFELLGEMELGPNPQVWKAAMDSKQPTPLPSSDTAFNCTSLIDITVGTSP